MATTSLVSNTTKISKFVDFETKKPVQHIYITPNFDSSKQYRCLWCTLFIDNEPIGCPIDTIDIMERIKNIDQKISIKFITFGTFCSFNCAKAYALDRHFDSKFKHSIRLLANMYSILNNTTRPITIIPSLHPTMLQCYGGDMTEAQYKESFDRIVYSNKVY